MIVIKINGYVNGFYDKLINVYVIDLANQISLIFYVCANKTIELLFNVRLS